MLEMRPCCERCGADLPPQDERAYICSFECTFCGTCTEDEFKGVCPNCEGQLVIRPTRVGAALEKFPASTKRIVKS